MRVLFSSIIIATISFLFIIPTIDADNGEIYEVGTSNSNLNVRSSPSLNAPVIGELQSGDQINVLQESFGWAQTYYDGKEAWVALHYLNKASISKGSEQNSKTDNVLEHQKEDNQSLEGYNIVIDPGHGGSDPGAEAVNGKFEKDIIMSTVDEIVSILQESGANVILTRNSDYFVSLPNRVYISNSYNTHAFISLHFNSHPVMDVNGVETHYYSGAKSDALANAMQSSLEQNTPLASRGIKQSDLYVLRESNAPSVLLELGFITNPSDLSAIKTKEYQNNIAKGVLDGLHLYLNQ
ncbi:N-acetylmuramoyl-L-alanine amidase [Virgibacillus saliphilus]|uniref:N-acetylmuramoyl-L-alanine amidase n=1 Tax=Virgibacillus saliphilus TaxID=2831674 RepID=UPI0028164B6D|nr:N-acetylmuramoyl-L-alanine amidase [Virgibacillus sp. NKC19-3]